MKYLKIVIYNLIAVAALFVLLEIVCRVHGPNPFSRTNNSDINVQKRMSLHKFDHQSIINELGPHIFDQPPVGHQSPPYNFDSLKRFSYADIDHSKVSNRSWTYSPDGLTRSSRFVKKIKNSDIKIFDVNYRMNQIDKRFVENQDKKTKCDSFVLAAGDSFTFGEGVDQGQDYPSTLASMIGPNWKVYNYGVTGDSANDFYTRFNFDPNYFSQITEQNGVLIWVYHEVQMQRLIFPTTTYKTAPYIANKAEYTLDRDELVYHGLFNQSERALRSLINMAATMAITSSFQLEFPKVFTEKNFELFFKLLNFALARIEESGHHFNKKIFVTYNAHNEFDLLKKVAERNGFVVLDIEKILFLRDKHYGGDLNLTIPVDGHPSPEAYWLLSTALKDKFF